MNWFNYFRLISLIEGFSYIFLIFIAMPLKYLNGNIMIVKSAGMIHGILFILFIIALVKFQKNEKEKFSMDFFWYSMVPFGFILIELFLKKIIKRLNQ